MSRLKCLILMLVPVVAACDPKPPAVDFNKIQDEGKKAALVGSGPQRQEAHGLSQEEFDNASREFERSRQN